ncbi:BN159_2729 family protein [Streptomyces sp. NPDC006967]|uniref:BN159_2729 family protein n=1 Tax=Streptomyces sp. NPDC006967 TaxID=3156906 RepID=UPI00341030F9
MNKNLPHAIQAIREVLASGGDDPATAIAHALDKAGLLTGIGRTQGLVLRRKPAGGWTQQTAQPEPTPDPQLTDLEQQAIAWDQSCQRARNVAAAIHAQIGEHPEFQGVQSDGDHVLVSLQITEQSRWAGWRTHFGIRHDGERPLPYAVCGEGYRDGVRVSVMAYDLPEARARAVKAAKRPFQLDGDVYDLARPQRDAGGEVWYWQGERAPDGMPLLSQDGRPERCRLDGVVAEAGPLIALTPSAAAVAESGDAR